MSLTIEELRFLRQINNKNVKLEKLANTNNMSTRNIRYKIENLNFYLKKYINKSIKIVNGTVIINILYDEEKKLFNMIEKSILKFSKEERQEIIINMYLFRENITLSKIEKILNVTRTTLNKDIKEINQKIKPRNISLALEGKRIALTGNEKKLRHYKAEQLLKYSIVKGKNIVAKDDFLPSSKIIQKMVTNYLNLLPMKEISICIDNIQKLLDVKFETGFYKMIFLYLVVTIERINSNHIIKRKNNEQFLKNLEQYKMLKEVLKYTINEDYKYEFLHLTEYFISGYSSTKFANSEYGINIFTQNILNQLEEKLKISLIGSRVLVEDIEEY
ncbi:MAG: helix-turn-helix domain-containing protein, partial [Romboutsia sp.]|uniref:helix-turn-helix domain-containing protein n=1 Tax=Romboutsia sp. TaxID=1965302 RepID=UPI003F3F272C